MAGNRRRVLDIYDIMKQLGIREEKWDQARLGEGVVWSVKRPQSIAAQQLAGGVSNGP